MLDSLINSVDRLGYWAYLIIFLIVAIEGLPLIGLIMPGVILVLAGGFFARHGVLSLGWLIAVVSAAAIIGDAFGYQLGVHLGRGWLLNQGTRLGFRKERLDRVVGFFVRHGGKAVIASHFMHLMRSTMPFIAGSCRMPRLRYFGFNAVGSLVWSIIFVLIGYFAGASREVASKWIGDAGEVACMLFLIVIALSWYKGGVRGIVRR